MSQSLSPIQTTSAASKRARSISIQTRLLTSSILLVLIPALIISSVAIYTSSQGLRSEVFGQLESVASLKQNQTRTWLQTLQTSLNLIVVDQQTIKQASAVLNGAEEDVLYDKARLKYDLNKYIDASGEFSEIFIMNSDGVVVISTDESQEGKIFSSQAFFSEGTKGPFINPPIYELSLSNYSIVISQPLKASNGNTIGVLAGRVNLTTLNEIMKERAGLGETGETYLVNSNFAVLTDLRFQETILGETYIHTEGINQAIQTKGTGSMIYPDYRNVSVMGVYHWIPELNIAVLAEHSEAEALQPVNIVLRISLIVTLITILFSSWIAFVITRQISTPIASLASAAESISQGNLNQEINIDSERDDEIGTLSKSFNLMTSRLRELIGSLEQRVSERTQALSTVAEIGTAASTMLKTDKLLQQVVDLTKDRFSFYHAHIYLLNDTNDTLILASGAGEPGRKMVAEGRSIPLDREQSLVARAAREKKGVIANDVTIEPDFLPNPLLPETHSELAVPMIVGEQVIGVFDVQSEVIGRFTSADIAIQTTLASQVASALQNARLYAQVETSAQEAQSLVDNAPEAIVIVDLTTGLFSNPNENAIKLYGLERAELIKVGPAQMSPPRQPDGRDSTEKAMEKIGQAMQGGIPIFEWMHRNGQGEDFLCEVRLARMPGDYPRVRASVTDISERKRNEELIRQRSQQQEALNLITQRIQSTTSIENALQVAVRELGHALGMKQTVISIDPTHVNEREQPVDEHHADSQRKGSVK